MSCLVKKEKKDEIPQCQRKQNFIDNISQGHPVDIALKLKILCASRPQKKAVSLVTEIIRD